VDFYSSVFKNSKIVSVTRYGEDAAKALERLRRFRSRVVKATMFIFTVRQRH
jgi:predicted 3-demethylubiquinone-9 3-methyltransferase (glyoxalase superfamily)